MLSASQIVTGKSALFRNKIIYEFRCFLQAKSLQGNQNFSETKSLIEKPHIRRTKSKRKKKVLTEVRTLGNPL